jgi:hypothetical protein
MIWGAGQTTNILGIVVGFLIITTSHLGVYAFVPQSLHALSGKYENLNTGFRSSPLYRKSSNVPWTDRQLPLLQMAPRAPMVSVQQKISDSRRAALCLLC